MLLDTSGLMRLFDRHDFRHSDAREFYNAASQRITHNYVLAEFVALANARPAPRKQSLAFVANLQKDPEVEIIWIDESLHNRAIELLQERHDKK
jgi:uncharacterized protein